MKKTKKYRDKMPKNIFIVGSRGYNYNYGGWETFVTQLVDNYHDKNTHFYICSLANTKNEQPIKINKNVTVIPIFTKAPGSTKMLFYSLKSFSYCVNYIKHNNLSNTYIYVLGLKLFTALKTNYHKCQKLGIKIYVNPDGLEHKRSKWSYPVKKFFLLSEKLMLNNCDLIVCDGLGIQKYVINKYPKLKNKTIYIAYGAKERDLSHLNEESILKEYNLKKDNYCLMVGRCVPENNYELVIKAFLNTSLKKDLVIITNLSSSNYYQSLKETTNFPQDKRIKFIDGVYDQDKLAVIRKNAYLYIHGHSVGGTNPSLLEALSLTDLNLLYDVCFNKDIGGSSCLYFKNSASLTKLLDDSSLLETSKKELGPQAKKIIKTNFTWDIIVNKYKEIFK